MSHYLKAIVAFLTALGTWGATALIDERIDGGEWFGIIGAVVAGLAVYQAKNKEGEI